jgi:hypothetical protein
VRIILDALNYVQNEQARLLALEEYLSSGIDTDIDRSGNDSGIEKSVTGSTRNRNRRRRRRKDSYVDPFGTDEPLPESEPFATTDISQSFTSPPHQSPRKTKSIPLLPEEDYIPISPELSMLQMRLEPVRQVEAMLISQLAAPNEEEATRLLPSLTGSKKSKTHGGGYGGYDQEVFVRSGYSWKSRMATAHARTASNANSNSNSSTKGIIPALQNFALGDSKTRNQPQTHWNGHSTSSGSSPVSSTGSVSVGTGPGRSNSNTLVNQRGWKDPLTSPNTNTNNRVNGHDRNKSSGTFGPDEVAKILYAARQDLLDLWRDLSVREILRKRKVKLEEGPGL